MHEAWLTHETVTGLDWIEMNEYWVKNHHEMKDKQMKTNECSKYMSLTAVHCVQGPLGVGNAIGQE